MMLFPFLIMIRMIQSGEKLVNSAVKGCLELDSPIQGGRCGLRELHRPLNFALRRGTPLLLDEIILPYSFNLQKT